MRTKAEVEFNREMLAGTDRLKREIGYNPTRFLQQRKSHQAQVLNQQLQHALNSRIVIEQAKGRVAVRESINMPAAFSALRSYARLHNLPLLDVARSVVDGSLGPSALKMSPQQGAGRDEMPS